MQLLCAQDPLLTNEKKVLFLYCITVNFHGCSCYSIKELFEEEWVMPHHPSAGSAHSHKLFGNPQLETSKKTPALRSVLRAGTQKRLQKVLSTERLHSFSHLTLVKWCHCQDPLPVSAIWTYVTLFPSPPCTVYLLVISMQEPVCIHLYFVPSGGFMKGL